jgi:hypothetical protein
MPGFYPPKLPANGRAPTVAPGTVVVPDATDDPVWTSRLVRGIAMMLWGIIAQLLGLSGAFTLLAERRSLIWPAMICAGIAIAGAGAQYTGTWWLTTPNPAGDGAKTLGRLRRRVRFWIVIRIGTIVAGAAATSVALFQLGRMSTAVSMTLIIADAVAGIGEYAGFFALLSYLSKLATRLRESELAALAGVLKFGFTGDFLVLVGLGIAMNVRRIDRAVIELLEPLALLSAIAGLVLLIFYIVLLEKLGRRLKLRRLRALSRVPTPAA